MRRNRADGLSCVIWVTYAESAFFTMLTLMPVERNIVELRRVNVTFNEDLVATMELRPKKYKVK